MKKLKRRLFLSYGLSLPVIGISSSCSEKSQADQKVRINQNLTANPDALSLSKTMNRDQLFSMLDQRVALAMERCHNCAQAIYLALGEQFGLGSDEVLKALTPLPGLGEKGNTCGALTGALMAIGTQFGRDRLDDWETYRKCLIPANQLTSRFETEMGTTMCCQIQERAFGKSFNLMDPEQLKEFQRVGATARCTKVVQKAARLAAEIILEHHI